ncbi:thioredoxin family protein [Lysobacter sp. D1-1-M9]|uniref:thioredoxin family protein n=1 Tax=Novilysobacter longmucuonensis TaxID=3098603 RepID=UPI002FC6CAB7
MTTRAYADSEPSRAAIDAAGGPLVVEFGAPWCGHCIAAQAPIEAALEPHPGVRHVKVEDGRGRRLGRSFRVKLWPTLVFLRDGEELTRLVRPTDTAAIREALQQIL